MRRHSPFVLSMLLAAVGCSESKYTPPIDDPEFYRVEQEKLTKLMQETGERRVGTYDPKNERDPEQAKLEQMMIDAGEERVNQPLPKKKPAAK